MANIVSEVHIESVEDGREVDENGFITLRIEASIPLSHISTRRLAPLDAPPPASIAQNIDQDDADYLPRRPRRRYAQSPLIFIRGDHLFSEAPHPPTVSEWSTQ